MNEYTLGFVISLRDQVTSTLKRVEGEFEHLHARVKDTEAWRRAGEGMAIAGAGMLAAGGAAALALRATIEPAIEMEAQLAHIRTAMDDGAQTAEHLAEVHEALGELSGQSVLGVRDLGEAYYLARSQMQTHEDALKTIHSATLLVEATTENATAAQQAMGDTTRTLTEMVNTFGGATGQYADVFAKLQTEYAFKNITELTGALKYAIPVTKTAGIELNQMYGILAGLNVTLHGEEAGTAFREFVTKLAVGKELHDYATMTASGGLDLVASVQAVYNRVKSLPKLEQERFIKDLGFGLRDITGLTLMLDKMGDVQKIASKLAPGVVAGTAEMKAAERLKSFDMQWTILGHNVDEVRRVFGEALLPTLNRLVLAMIPLVQGIRHFAEAHPGIVKFAVGFLALSAAILIPVGTLLIFLGAIAMSVSYMPALWAGLSAVAYSFAGLIPWIYSATSAVVVFLATNPVGWAILAIAALAAVYVYWDKIKPVLSAVVDGVGAAIGGLKGLAVIVIALASPFLSIPALIVVAFATAVTLIVSNWQQISGFFISLWASLKGGLSSFGAWFMGHWKEIALGVSAPLGWIVAAVWNLGPSLYTAGIGILKSLGDGILKGISWPIEAAKGLATKLKNLFVGQSPPPEGPLRQIHRTRIVETIAESLNPAPAVAAARRVAQAVAMSLPLTMTPMLAAAPAMAATQVPPVAAYVPRAEAPPAVQMPALLPAPAMPPAAPPSLYVSIAEPLPIRYVPPPVVPPILPALFAAVPPALPPIYVPPGEILPAPYTPQVPATAPMIVLPNEGPKRSVTIHLTYSPTITVGAGKEDDVRRLLDDHKRELLDQLRREQERAERTAY
jgi:TP901 family phage tail tape measure protein